MEGIAPSGGWIRRQYTRDIELGRAGQRRVELALRENFYFSDHGGSILVFGTGKKGNRLERSGNQITFEGAVTEWAKVLRLPWTATAGRHTRKPATGAHTITKSPVIVLFSGLLMKQYLLTTYVTGFCSVAVLYTLHGERPFAILGTS